jgi:ferredoxin
MTGPVPAVFVIQIEDSGETFLCGPEQNLLRAMEKLGRRGIPIGCRGGGCGVCKVQALEGSYLGRKMSREHVSIEDEARGIGLACRMLPRSDMRLKVLGAMGRMFTPATVAAASGSRAAAQRKE